LDLLDASVSHFLDGRKLTDPAAPINVGAAWLDNHVQCQREDFRSQGREASYLFVKPPGQLLEAFTLRLCNRLDITFSSNARLLVWLMATVRIGT
jgi:hypothetical protein